MLSKDLACHCGPALWARFVGQVVDLYHVLPRSPVLHCIDVGGGFILQKCPITKGKLEIYMRRELDLRQLLPRDDLSNEPWAKEFGDMTP